MTVKKEKRRVSFTLSESVWEFLESVAAERGLSKSAIVTLALENLKEGEEKKK